LAALILFALAYLAVPSEGVPGNVLHSEASAVRQVTIDEADFIFDAVHASVPNGSIKKYAGGVPAGDMRFGNPQVIQHDMCESQPMLGYAIPPVVRSLPK
jgi:hypothetical protein